MEQKQFLKKLRAQIKRTPYWAFLAVAFVLFTVSVFALRANNQKMLELRQAVFVADEQDGDIELALQELRGHVYAHMNTDLAVGDNAIRPPIQLKHRYERLVEAEQKKLQKSSGRDVYQEAQEHCEKKFPSGFSGSNRLPCIREYLDTHGPAEVPEVSIPEDLYKFDFISPRWSPDLAGLSLLGGAVSLLGFVLFAASEQLIKRQLRRQ